MFTSSISSSQVQPSSSNWNEWPENTPHTLEGLLTIPEMQKAFDDKLVMDIIDAFKKRLEELRKLKEQMKASIEGGDLYRY